METTKRRRNRRLERCALSALCLIAGSAGGRFAAAQLAATTVGGMKIPVYDVVSIKPNKTHSGGVDIDVDDGNFAATNVSLKTMIRTAYGLKDAQVFDLPPWGTSARFDIRAKVIDPDKKMFDGLTDEQNRSMLRPVLADRFHLTFHRESRVLPVYELVVAKDGPKFKESELKQGDGKTINGMGAGSVSVHNRDLTAVAAPMDQLADHLSSTTQRIVVDKTGLKGRYDLQLKWSADDGAPVDADAPPSLFTALQEQLGLRLQPAKAPVETFVVDHAELPVED